MANRLINAYLLRSELLFSTSRSSGPGGQNVNKVESKVTLRFDVIHSTILTENEKEIIERALVHHLNKDRVLLLTAQESRSQADNKAVVLGKLDNLLAAAFRKKKTRKATKPSRSSKIKRLHTKKARGDKKKWRQKP